MRQEIKKATIITDGFRKEFSMLRMEWGEEKKYPLDIHLMSIWNLILMNTLSPVTGIWYVLNINIV